MIKLLSLFSGIGAFEAALRRGGYQFETVNYCEIDPYASKAYSQIHGISEDFNLHDVRTVNPLLMNNVNLVTYGFPCQDISVAGKQKGFEHDGERTRSGLFFEALRIIEFLQPEYAICENVKALTSKKFTAEFQTVLSGLSEAGYNNYWEVLNAKDYGIPQNRERIFIISIRKDIDTGTFKFPEKQPLQLRVKDMLEPEVDEKFYINSERAKKLIEKITATPEIVGGGIENRIKTIGHLGTGGQKGWVFNSNGISRCLAATDYKDPTKIVETKTMIKITEPVICASRGRNPDNPGDRTTGAPNEQRLEVNSKGISNTLTTVQKDNLIIEPKIKNIGSINGHQSGIVNDSNGLSRCLTAVDYKDPVKIIEKIKWCGSVNGHQSGAVIHEDGCCCCLNVAGHVEPQKIMIKKDSVKQIGNIVTTGNFKNPQRGRIYDSEGISPCLNTMQGGGLEPKFIEPVICASRGRNPDNPGDRTAGVPTEQRLEPNMDGVSNTLTTVQKDNYLLEPKMILQPVVIGSTQKHASVNTDGTAPCLTAMMGLGGGNVPMITDNQQNDCCGYRIRKLTPLECFRLMGFSDEEFNRIKGVSNTQLYKMAGNSIVVNVLEAIFKQLFKENHK